MLTDKSEGSTAFDIRPVRSLADARLLGSTFARAFNRDPWYRYVSSEQLGYCGAPNASTI